MRAFKKAKGRNVSFLRQSFFSFLIITIICTILLTAFLTFTYLHSMIGLISRYNDKLIAQSNYSITYLDETAKKLGTALFGDKDIITYLNMKKHDTLSVLTASRVIDKHLLTLNDIDSVYLYNTKLDLFYSSRTGEQRPAALFSDTEITAMLSDKSFVASYDGRPVLTAYGNTPQSLSCSYLLLEPGVNASGLKNSIVINMRASALIHSIQAINRFDPIPDMSFAVADANGTILSTALSPAFDNEMDTLGVLCQNLKSLDSTANRIHNIGGVRYLVSCSKSNANNWYIMSITPVRSIFSDAISAAVIAAGLVVLVFVFCAAICMVLARKLNSPIQAITQIMTGSVPEKSDAAVSETEEFEFILSVFHSMREQNQQLDKIKHETAYTAKQDFLNALLAGTGTYSLEKNSEKLHSLRLDYLAQNQLCMCLLKIDNYGRFVSQNSQKERWALRYAIVNITTEVAENYGVCEIFSCSSDKFLMLIDCASVTQYKVLQEKLERFLHEVQSQTQKCLQLSLSVAYSTMFSGLEHLSSMYEVMKASILLKIRYGHECIITPYMADETNTDELLLPIKKEELLIEKVLAGDSETACAAYAAVTKNLYHYAYSEILSFLIHLVYRVYSAALSKLPAMQENQDSVLQEYLNDIQRAETGADIDIIMTAFLQKLCCKIVSAKETAGQPGNDFVVQRVIEIVEQKYPDSGLCLSLIAEELRLSPNYVGHIFKSAQGMSVAQYIFVLRMQKLDHFMRTTRLSQEVIIEKVGLEKSNYFYTRFKKHFGMSLSEYKLHLSDAAPSDSDDISPE